MIQERPDPISPTTPPLCALIRIFDSQPPKHHEYKSETWKLKQDKNTKIYLKLDMNTARNQMKITGGTRFTKYDDIRKVLQAQTEAAAIEGVLTIFSSSPLSYNAV